MFGGKGVKERLSGIIYRCRAVYRAFALRSLVRVLYVYTIYIYIYSTYTTTPWAFCVYPTPLLAVISLPLTSPYHPAFGISRIAGEERIRKEGHGWACFPLRGSTIVTRRLYHPSRSSTYFDFGRLFDCVLGLTKGGT